MKSIKMGRAVALVFAGAYMMMPGNTAKADPPMAEERAHQVAVKFKDRGFYVTPIDAGILLRGQMVRVQIPVTRGLDYVIMASGDQAARDVDIYVYSEVDTLILDDRRSLSDAVVQFRSQYTGSVYAYVFMARTDPTLGLPSWAAFVGRRGTARSPVKGSPTGPIESATSNPNAGGSPSAADSVTPGGN
ncbi:hypothetical protein VSU19_13115 [Verrucomicrobiales bacterium BCK34]|nr:hypothetical protein [Verrucomicrobiales bacterium BCK34]